MQLLKSSKLTSLIMVILLTSGCTTINPYTGEKQVSDSTIGAGIGTAGGAVIGALVGGGRGALIGGVLGGVTGGTIGHIHDNENEELRQILTGTGVQVKRVGNTTQLIMASDVTFATNQSALVSSLYPTLNSVAVVFKKYKKNTIIITGYTDNVGNAAYNQTLSEQRAMSVGDYLIGQGIPSNRIFTEGQGKRNPIATNETSAGRALNRRVVITLRPLS